MHICRPLVLILSLAACEHASTATSTSTLPEEAAPAEVMTAPAPTVEGPAPTPIAQSVEQPAPAAKLVAPKPAADPTTGASEECRPYRATRAAVKWRERCEPVRVTKKPLTPNTTTPGSAGTAKP